MNGVLRVAEDVAEKGETRAVEPSCEGEVVSLREDRCVGDVGDHGDFNA